MRPRAAHIPDVRLHLLGDLHLEFRAYDEPSPEADVVVLAGDVATGLRGIPWARSRWPETPVVYVAGNHEYYGDAVPRLTEKLRWQAEQRGIHFLENESVEIGGVRFLGCTLWTDFLLGGDDARARAAAAQVMADYRKIRLSPEYRRVRPEDTAGWHARSRRWLEEQVRAGATAGAVVVTHHAPSLRSVPPEYRADPVTAAFASGLDELVERSGAAVWVHGHTHHCVDYAIGGTRVLANQRGYPDEGVTAFDPALVIDVGG